MVKKKTIETETEKKQKTHESTDNKGNNNTEGKINEGTPDEEASKEPQASKGTQGEETDKGIDKTKVFEEKLAEMQDKYIRLSAEFDNYRRRTLREKMELAKYADENLLLKIIPLMDDFDRALSHMDSATDCTAMKSGIDLIYGKFQEFLKQNGIKEIESLNTVFNVDLHEAVAKIGIEDVDKKGKVVDVLQKGYFLHDKVLRFSKVAVGE